MKILVVGSDRVDAIENFYVKYLKEAGAEILHFTSYTFFYNYYQKSLLNKLIFKSGLSNIYRSINKKLLENISIFGPDILWVFKGMEIYPSTLKKIRQKGIKLANYNPDNPFIFSGSGSGNSNITKSISLYDLHFTYNLSVKEKLESDFNARTCFLPFGFDINTELVEEAAKQEEIIKACFVGNPDKHRASFLKSLGDKGIPIDVYGHNWDKHIDHPNIKIFDPVYGPDFWKVLRKYRVQINLMRIHNPDSHNMRSFEIPGVGGIMVAPDTREHRMFFEDKKEIFLYAGVAHCKSVINDVLALNRNHANKIREKALIKSNEYGYTYKNRTNIALRELIKINGG